MKRLLGMILAAVAVAIISALASAQPPERKEPPPRNRDGFGGPPRFELGRVLPPPLVEELELTTEQRDALAELEKEVKTRLEKILTADQQKKAAGFRPKGPPGGPEGPPRNDRRNDRDAKPDQPPKQTQNGTPAAGIQWFATLESGRREARRTGRPILLVSAAPSCAGVPGVW